MRVNVASSQPLVLLSLCALLTVSACERAAPPFAARATAAAKSEGTREKHNSAKTTPKADKPNPTRRPQEAKALPSAAAKPKVVPRDRTPFPNPKAPKGPVTLIDAPDDADAAVWIREQLVEAARAGQAALVYVGAVWCEPCERFKKAAAAGELNDALTGLRLLVFDADRHGEALRRAGYRWSLVPLFVRPTATGRSSGLQQAGVPSKAAGAAEIVPRVQALIAAGPR